jgi:hypothetical protein
MFPQPSSAVALHKQVRLLMISNAASWLVVVFLVTTGFAAQQQRTKFTEIDAERVNIVNSNGQPVVVLAGQGKLPGAAMNGKTYPPALSDGRELMAGMIFFNQYGDEVGGLIFNGLEKKPGYSSVGHFSLDQWKQNQVIALQYVDSGTTRRAGLNIWDRPTDVGLDVTFDRMLKLRDATGAERDRLRKEADEARAHESGAERVFVGSQDKSAQVRLRDTKGRVRARLVVGADDVARLEFLDEAGAVTSQYPPK